MAKTHSPNFPPRSPPETRFLRTRTTSTTSSGTRRATPSRRRCKSRSPRARRRRGTRPDHGLARSTNSASRSSSPLNFDATGGAQAGRNSAALAGLVKAQQDALAKTQAEAIASEQLLLDQALAHNMISYQDFYAQREVLERKDADLKIAGIEASMAAEQKQSTRPRTPQPNTPRWRNSSPCRAP